LGADKVVVALDVPTGAPVAISVRGVFADGAKLRDFYSGARYVVKGGVVRTSGKAATILLAPAQHP
jgi:alpha-amylase